MSVLKIAQPMWITGNCLCLTRKSATDYLCQVTYPDPDITSDFPFKVKILQKRIAANVSVPKRKKLRLLHKSSEYSFKSQISRFLGHAT